MLLRMKRADTWKHIATAARNLLAKALVARGEFLRTDKSGDARTEARSAVVTTESNEKAAAEPHRSRDAQFGALSAAEVPSNQGNRGGPTLRDFREEERRPNAAVFGLSMHGSTRKESGIAAGCSVAGRRCESVPAMSAACRSHAGTASSLLASRW